MNKENFSVINYTDQEIPVFREKQGQKFVTYGADDMYGDYLRDLFISSSTNGAIINGVADMIFGGGLDATDKDESDEKREQWLRLQDLLRKSDDDLLQKVAFDLKLYGMTYLNVIWNSSRTRIACMKHLPVHTMRSGVADSEGVISEFYYKSDWREKREAEKAIKAFSNEDRTAASTCLQIKRYTPSLHYYALPDYAGGTNYIELDQEISEFHLNNIRRGFFPSMLLSFKNGVPTQQERRVIEQKVLDKFTGADNAGRILITFNDGDETAPEFTPITQNGADGMYEYLSKLVSEKIITAHRVVSPLIFGVRSEGGGFGNNADELRDSYSLFNNTVVVPFQNILLKSLGMLFGINDIELDIFFITAKPADFLDLDVIDTLDEGEQKKEGMTAEAEEFSKKKRDVYAESITDYPKGVKSNAQKVLDFVDKNGWGSCGTGVGKQRANQLANGEPISIETVQRMANYLTRHAKDLDSSKSYTDGCGKLMYDAWGGKAGLRWANSKLKQLDLSKNEMKDCVSLSAADSLIELGQAEEDLLKDYEMIDERQVDYDSEDKFDAMWSFATAKVPSGKPQAKSEQDTELIKVRYTYAPNKLGINGNPSRSFCTKMVNAKRVYRKEDILLASDRAINPGWGPAGSDFYNVWFYKGGGSCQHYWMRKTYLKKNNKSVSVNQAKRIIQANNGTPLQANDPLVATLPRDQKNRGFINPEIAAAIKTPIGATAPRNN
jgi:hypothetical protein